MSFRGDDFQRAFDLAEEEPEIIRWRDLDAAAVDAELTRLADWVDWLANRYNLDHKLIPPCWPEHGAPVEELSALRTLWEASYLEDANPAGPLAFHRDLDLSLRRLREWTSRLGCTRTEHRREQPTHERDDHGRARPARSDSPSS